MNTKNRTETNKTLLYRKGNKKKGKIIKKLKYTTIVWNVNVENCKKKIIKNKTNIRTML